MNELITMSDNDRLREYEELVNAAVIFGLERKLAVRKSTGWLRNFVSIRAEQERTKRMQKRSGIYKERDT